MGKAHAIAFSALSSVFSCSATPVREILADVDEAAANRAAAALGFRRSTGDWRSLVADPDVDVVDICSPNHLHKEMAAAALEAGKHVYCEKPLTLSAADSLALTQSAARMGLKTLVGFNYAKNPATRLAKEIIESGEIGEVLRFRGAHDSDYLSDPETPHGWRCVRRLAGFGALGDIGSHIVHMAGFLIGDIESVCAELETVIPERPLPDGSGRAAVENDDQARSLVRFANGVGGVIEASRVATGRKLGLVYEVSGTRGAVSFNQERMNELMLYEHVGPAGRRGFRTVLIGPEHSDYGAFCPAGGHGLGFNDQKIIEARDLVEGICADRTLTPDFEAAWKVDRVLEAMDRSSRERRWVQVEEI